MMKLSSFAAIDVSSIVMLSSQDVKLSSWEVAELNVVVVVVAAELGVVVVVIVATHVAAVVVVTT
jgi:hypothetical protein